MKIPVIAAVVTILVIAFVFVWVRAASLGAVPVIQAPLESVSPFVRLVVLVILTVIIGVIYSRTKKSA